MPNTLLRVRGLKTNFYTYAGVVQALEGVNFDMMEGETLGLVGETGCGKSVTALSILRLIPQPPGRIEEGEVLFDVPPDVVAEIDRLEFSMLSLLPRIFGGDPEARPEDLSARRLRVLWDLARQRPNLMPSDLEAFRSAATALLRFKERYDLLEKNDGEMRKIRGNQIAMIFQDPMQSLNPVFPIGDQIGENILLHQKGAVISSLVQKMELESERDAIAATLARTDPAGRSAPGRLPGLRPVARTTLMVGGIWMALGAVAGAAYGLLGLAQGSAGYGILSAWGLITILAAGALIDLRPVARTAGLALAGLDALIRIVMLLLTLPMLARLSLGVVSLPGAALTGFITDFVFQLGVLGADLFVLRHVTREDAPVEFSGRRSGWAAALFAAEGEPNELSEIRDLVAESGLEDRDALVERLDTLIEKAKAVLLPNEPITGHYWMLIPRRVQLAVYQAARDQGTMGMWDHLPILGWTIRKPLNEEGVRWGVNMLRRVRIPDPERIAGQYPYELSGGMQQRALIAIALSCNPRLLIADEPTTALDVTIQAQILELIREMKKAFGSSVLLITHDLGIIAEMCNRVCVMYAGHIVEDASVRAVFRAPLHPYTQGLMKAIPSHTVRKDFLEIIRGSVPNLIYPPPGCRFHPRCPAVMPTCGWSPKEVGDHVRDALRQEADAAFAETLEFEEVGPSELVVTFPAGTAEDVAIASVQRAVHMGKADPAIGAIVAVEPRPRSAAAETPERAQATVRILAAYRPPAFVPEPNHFVACLLYEEGAKPLAGGATGG